MIDNCICPRTQRGLSVYDVNNLQDARTTLELQPFIAGQNCAVKQLNNHIQVKTKSQKIAYT